jgi:rRNA maturation endonuclease Nob1
MKHLIESMKHLIECGGCRRLYVSENDKTFRNCPCCGTVAAQWRVEPLFYPSQQKRYQIKGE